MSNEPRSLHLDAGVRTLRSQTRLVLREALVSGRFGPGERLNEVEIAAEIGVSRGTLREAIRNLEQEGFLVCYPHRGTFVRRFTEVEASELHEVRLALEMTAATRVSRELTRSTQVHLEGRLRELGRAYELRLPFAERMRADLGFHEAICVASANATLLDVWRSLVANITVMVLSVGEALMTPLQDPRPHRELLDAILSGREAEIREVFTRHFNAGAQVVASAVGAQATRSAPGYAAPC